MIYHSYACRSGKGVHDAARRVQHDLRVATRAWGSPWVLKADISKYFPSIDHDILRSILPRTVREKSIIDLFGHIISGSGFDDRGLPVGALTSQLFANIYLDKMDHIIKDNLGIKHYVRYMDDFIIVFPSKVEAQELLTWLRHYLPTELRLSLNPKTIIFPASARMVDFAGYRICKTHMVPRKRNIKRARRAFKKMVKAYAVGDIDLSYIKPRVASFIGYTKHCQAIMSTKSVLGELVLTRTSVLS